MLEKLKTGEFFRGIEGDDNWKTKYENAKAELNKKDAIIRDLSKQLTKTENELERYKPRHVKW